MEKLAAISGRSVHDLQTAPVEELVSGQGKLGIKMASPYEEDGVFALGPPENEWPVAENSDLEAILIGDCQWESRGFEPLIMSLGMERLKEYFFSRYEDVGRKVADIYQIDFSSPEVARSPIGRFINDVRFALASHKITQLQHKVGKLKCYRYIVDVSDTSSSPLSGLSLPNYVLI